MTFDCAISLNYQGDPMIKVTKDCPKVTLDVYTDDLNALKALIEQPLVLKERE